MMAAAQADKLGPLRAIGPKKVRLSMKNLQEYEKHLRVDEEERSDKTKTSVSSRSTNTRSSLYGVVMSIRALQITRRLSRSFAPDISRRTTLSKISNASAKKENTFRTQPEENEKFCASAVSREISGTLALHLKHSEYSAEDCPRLCLSLSNTIKERVKAMNYPRYKIVATVFIGQKHKQGIEVASRCLWDTELDAFATGKFENSSLYATGTVYGVYFE